MSTMTLAILYPPRKTIPHQEMEIIGQAIRHHMKANNLKPSDSLLPDTWCCEVDGFVVHLRTVVDHIATYEYFPTRMHFRPV